MKWIGWVIFYIDSKMDGISWRAKLALVNSTKLVSHAGWIWLGLNYLKSKSNAWYATNQCGGDSVYIVHVKWTENLGHSKLRKGHDIRKEGFSGWFDLFKFFTLPRVIWGLGATQVYMNIELNDTISMIILMALFTKWV